MSMKMVSGYQQPSLIGKTGSARLERLENRRERLDQSFEQMEKEALDNGDTAKAKQIFEISKVFEDRMDKRLDRLEAQYGDSSSGAERQLDNALDDLRAAAYNQEDGADQAKKAFDLSQTVKKYISNPSDLKNQVLLKQLVSDLLGTTSSADITSSTSTTSSTGTTSSTSTTATGNS